MPTGKANKEERKISWRNNQTKEQEESHNLLIGGDFNGRTGRERGVGGGSIEEDIERKSKVKIINKEREKLVEIIEKKRWNILNGNTEGDDEGESTYVGPRGDCLCNSKHKDM